MIRLSILLAFLLSPSATEAGAMSPASGRPVARAEDSWQSSGLKEVMDARSLDPDSPQALERLSELLGKAKDDDGELAYLLYAIDAYDKADGMAEKDRQAKIRSLERKLTRVGDGLGKLRSSRNAYLKELTWVLRLYANNQKKMRSALEVGGRVLAYRPDHSVARRMVEELMASGDEELRKEGQRLLNQKELTRSRTFLTEWAQDHRRWRNAGTIQSKHYIVNSNIGYDVANKAAHSLDRIADYYAEFFEVDSSKITERTPVFLFRTREEFIRGANTPFADQPGLLAFITSSYGEPTGSKKPELRSEIFGYDPRDQGRALDSLWPTLWHEASHQYMSLVTQGRQSPHWINEGMSSYFEGARFNQEGEILVGLPARDRLENLTGLLEAGYHPLKGMLPAEGTLSGLHYAVFWGVVFYLNHGRDGEGNLLRPKAMPKILQLLRYRELEGWELFEKGVLATGKESFEDFQTAWEAWILTLMDRESDVTERSEHFATLGLKQLKAGNEKLARTLFDEALLRAPGCLDALHGLSNLHLAAWEETRKKDRDLADDTLYWGNRLYAAALEVSDEAVLASATEICGNVDKAGFKKVKKAEAKYRKSIEALLHRTVEGGRPKTAVAIARLFMDDILGGSRRDELARQLRVAGTLTLQRPFKAFDGKSLGGLSCGAKNFKVRKGMIQGTAKRPDESLILIDRDLSPLFHLEGEFRLGDSNSMLGLCYSNAEANSIEGFLLRLADREETEAPKQAYQPFDKLGKSRVGQLSEAFQVERMTTGYVLDEQTRPLDEKWKAGDWLTFRLSRITTNELVLCIEGEVVDIRPVDPEGGDVSLGLLLWGGELSVRQLEAVELDRL